VRFSQFLMSNGIRLNFILIGLAFMLPAIRIDDRATPKKGSTIALSGKYLKVVSGFGEVTQSDYPKYMPPNSPLTRKKVNGGGYDPGLRKLTLEVEGRQIEISLKTSLTENSKIEFSVSRITRGQDSPPLIHYLDPRLWIDNGFQTRGVLSKRGSRISGEFASQGGFLLNEDRISSKAKVKGRFTLLVLSGKSSDIPNPYKCYRTLTPDSSGHYCHS